MVWPKVLAGAKTILEAIRNFGAAGWTAAFIAVLVLTSFVQSLFIMHANRVARDAASAANKVADALQASERAYVAEQIVIRRLAQDAATSQEIPTHDGNIEAAIRFKNFGRTPATLKAWAATLYADRAVRKATHDPKLFAVRLLASGEETAELVICTAATQPLLAEQSETSPDQRLNFWVSGYVEFDDIFGRNSKREFVWRYDYPQKCFVPHYFSILEDDI